MLENIFQKKPSKLDEPIDKVLFEMATTDEASEEYTTLMNHLERLMAMKREERSNRVSPDTWAVVGGNLAGILTIVAYEQKHVMVSKALGMVLRSKQTNP
jgi:hypothetical protein